MRYSLPISDHSMLSVGLGRFDSRVGVRKHSKTSPRGEAVSYIKRLSTQMGGVVNENTHHRYTARDCRRLRQREAPWPGRCQSMSDMAGLARPEFLRQPAPRPSPACRCSRRRVAYQLIPSGRHPIVPKKRPPNGWRTRAQMEAQGDWP
jgi:hypothetical protein